MWYLDLDWQYDLDKGWDENADDTAFFNYLFGNPLRLLYINGIYTPQWSQIVNKIKVVGYSDPATGITYSGSYQLPATHKYSPESIGERAEVLNHPELTTNDLCVQRAQYEVWRRLKSIDRSSHNLILIPFLTEGDCVQLENPEAGIPYGKYEIQAITENLANSEQTIEVWQVS